MKHKIWRGSAMAAIAAFTLFGTVSPAFAVGSDTTGSKATGDSSGVYHVHDTKCDGDPAYAWIIEKGTSGVQKRTNNGGCHSDNTGDIGSAISSIQACRDTTWAADNCGGWNEW